VRTAEAAVKKALIPRDVAVDGYADMLQGSVYDASFCGNQGVMRDFRFRHACQQPELDR